MSTQEKEKSGQFLSWEEHFKLLSSSEDEKFPTCLSALEERVKELAEIEILQRDKMIVSLLMGIAVPSLAYSAITFIKHAGDFLATGAFKLPVPLQEIYSLTRYATASEIQQLWIHSFQVLFFIAMVMGCPLLLEIIKSKKVRSKELVKEELKDYGEILGFQKRKDYRPRKFINQIKKWVKQKEKEEMKAAETRLSEEKEHEAEEAHEAHLSYLAEQALLKIQKQK